jgi:hypothetical protein
VKRALAPVKEELAIWRGSGRVLPFWWRDDDATEPTPALDKLLGLAADLGAPLHLAVVPEPAGPDLANRLAAASRTMVIPHGWRHRNHAPAAEKKAEFGAHRSPGVMHAEIGRGWQRLQRLFGKQALPVFAPPWNRIAPAVVAALPAVGLAAISTYLPRREKHAAPGLLQVNTHVDPIDWQKRRLLDPAAIAAVTVARLSARRKRSVANEEPFGLLTHHLVHDDDIWSLTAAFVEIILESGAARFVSPLAELGPSYRQD